MQPACRKFKTLFLECEVFNTSVDKFVEIKAAVCRNFRQFNALARIALFVCNFGVSRLTDTKSEDRGLTASVQNWNSIQEEE
jgi:hypothetical protein